MMTLNPDSNNMMSAKRIRVDETENAALASTEGEGRPSGQGDCYDEEALVLTADAVATAPNEIHSSWLRNDSWLSHAEGMTDDSDGESQREGPAANQAEALQRQLCLLKRRLGPAAEECAAACNAQRQQYCVNNDKDALAEQDEEETEETTAGQEFEEARCACNPYEVLGQHHGLNRLFVNRSAIKLANLDALIGLSMTRYDAVGPFLFADLCAAPGGFSEYIMYRCNASGISSCRGYGMSLSGVNEHGRGTEWKLDHMARIRGGNFTHYCVCVGADGTGDIYNWDNVRAMQQEISVDWDHLPLQDRGNRTEQGKVHLVVADGGFDAQRDCEFQEELTQKIVVCQAAAAVALLRLGGMFVVKMFGFQTAVIRALMAELFFIFESIIVLKPIASRPASAERYVVFAGYGGAPVDFDGMLFRNRVFLGAVGTKARTTSGTVATKETTTSSSVRLDKYLDRIDRDIMRVNMKTCFDILTYLVRKRQTATSAAAMQRCWTDWTDNRIDPELYKLAWSLS